MDEASPEDLAEPAGGQSVPPPEQAAVGSDYGEGPELFEGEEDADEDTGRVETVDEQGRRHVRLAAPEGTEEILEREAPRRTGLPDWAERWRVRSAAGTVLTAVAFGLQQVFEEERKEPAIIMETSGEPPTDLPVEAQLEQLGPRQSSVTVRPWLLGPGGQGAATGEEPGGEVPTGGAPTGQAPAPGAEATGLHASSAEGGDEPASPGRAQREPRPTSEGDGRGEEATGP